MKWFKHDSNAHTDTKLKKLRHEHGITGYGLYWYCLELISGKVCKENITFELEDDAETIAIDWNLDQIKVQEIMVFMCNLGLFDAGDGVITCLKLAKRLDDTNSKNPEIRNILNRISPKNSEQIREAPKNSAQTRLDQIRLEDKKDNGQNRFDQFWKEYPKKRKKKQAKEIWRRKKLDDKFNEIITDIQIRIENDKRWKGGFIPDPTTYLNGERWDDECEMS
jgi:hypothetical protein